MRAPRLLTPEGLVSEGLSQPWKGWGACGRPGSSPPEESSPGDLSHLGSGCVRAPRPPLLFLFFPRLGTFLTPVSRVSPLPDYAAGSKLSDIRSSSGAPVSSQPSAGYTKNSAYPFFSVWNPRFTACIRWPLIVKVNSQSDAVT